MFPKKKKVRKQPWSLTWNLKIRPCKKGEFHCEKNHFRFQGVVFGPPPTCSQLQWSWRLEPSKIQNLNSSLVTSILFSQPFLKTKHQKKSRGFLFHRIVALTKKNNVPTGTVGGGKLLIWLSCNFFVPPLQFARLQEVPRCFHTWSCGEIRNKVQRIFPDTWFTRSDSSFRCRFWHPENSYISNN